VSSYIRLIGAICCALVLGISASAQVQTTTSITGTVSDPGGAIVPGVKITVRSDETGAVRETLTNDAGYYAVQALRPGIYTITATHPGALR
jgi:protocatechuate 3,4-dioxygenase beta subunit